MKLKLLLALAGFIVGGGNLWADDVYKDVTSQYLTNADFEGEYSVYSYPRGESNKDRAIYQPSGWDIEYTSGKEWDMSILKSGDLASNSFDSKPRPTSGGAQTYLIRFNNSHKDQKLGLYQNVVLPGGSYRVTIDYYKGGSGGDAYLVVNSSTQNSSTNDSWSTVSLSFTSDGSASTKIGFRADHTNTYEKFYGVDNFLLEWNVTKALSDLIDFTTTEYNKDTSKTALKAAIDAATEKKTSTDADELVAAINTLQQAYEDSFKASAADYENLTAAINTVKGKAFGFDAGEYAPYNYVEVLKELAEAEAIDQTAFNTHEDVQALVTALNGAAWTTNSEEVNAIWDASFQHDYSGLSGNVQPIAWHGINNHDNATDIRYMGGSDAGLAATTSNKALFTKYNAFYGTETGYTLPLNESTYYTLSFVYGGWNDCKKDGYVTMTTPAENNLALLPTENLPLDATDGHQTKDSWKSYQAIFQTAEAGNYKLGLRKKNENVQSQYVYGDFRLMQTTVAEATAYYNSVLAEVSPSYNDEANGGSEKTAFKAAIDASLEGKTVAEIMEAAAALPSLRDAFVAATPKYEALAAVNAQVVAVPTLIYADASKKPAAVVATSADEAVAKTTSQTLAIRAYYESNGKAEGVTGAVDFTSAITNPAAEEDGNNGWTVSGMNNSRNDQKPTASDGTTTYKYFDGGSWSATSWNASMSQDITIPAGRYLLTVAARGADNITFQLSVGGETLDLPHTGSTDNVYGNGWTDASVAFTTKTKEVTIAINASSSTQYEWFSVTNFRLMQLEAAPLAVEEDYAALNAAITTAETKILGFEAGQYAPYNNVVALEALATAKAIDQSSGNGKEYVNETKDALAAANENSWTANATDVDAIYNGDFSLEVGAWDAAAWTSTGWAAKVDNINENNSISNTGKGWRPNTGTITYGSTGVYTMPLAEQQLYKLTFKYGAWDGTPVPTISVLNETDGLAATTIDGTDTKYQTAMTTQTMYFKTGAAGNYILRMSATGNMVWTDVSLVKADESKTVLDESSVEAPEVAYYQNVILIRTLSSDYWNTFTSPVDISADEIKDVFGDGYMVREMDTESEVTDNVIKFKDATEIVAGKPYLVKPAQEVANPTFAGKKVVAVGQEVVNGDYKFIGILTKTHLTAPADGATALDLYLATNNTMKKPGASGANIKGMRAYFNIPVAAAEAGVKLSLGEDVDAITVVDGEPVAGAAIYNLAGQRLQKMQKGVNIVGGRKVIVK